MSIYEALIVATVSPFLTFLLSTLKDKFSRK